MELHGTIKKIFAIQTYPSGFQKREMILSTIEQYPQPISIELLGDKIDILDQYSEGEEVKVKINIRGREWVNPQGETKYFNTITAWQISRANSTQNTAPKPATQPQPAQPLLEEEEEDDLPFN